MREQHAMQGALSVQLADHAGRVVRQMHCQNRIVTSGRNLVAQLFGGQSGGVPPSRVTHMAVGTDNTPPTDTDTALRAERAPRKAITSVDYSEITEGEGVNLIRRVRARLTAVFDFNDANGTEALQEAGIFTAETAGIMYNRVVFEPVTKTNAFKLTLLWDIVF
jgi:hypothetical protein